MHIHILGICGTFMGSLAVLARELGHDVSGSDANVYPPMSTQLEAQNISLHEGYDADYLQRKPDCVIVGNAMTRGNPAVEALLESQVPYCSGPEWLRQNVLRGRWVLAVAGTHGKTTTTSMLAKILQHAGKEPGFLIGGVAADFPVSAQLGGGRYFVIEADEYDSAFFDKRSKFVHYLARTLIMNNLEFDHADIFADLAAIQRQFHHLIRTIPASGRILMPMGNAALQEVIAQGCWSELEELAVGPTEDKARWQLTMQDEAGRKLQITDSTARQSVSFNWPHSGQHNAANALAAVAAAEHVGVPLEMAAEALSEFSGVKRRMEKLYERGGITVYDDFAHHPTAIQSTLEGLRKAEPAARIVAVIEPRSNTMRMGVQAQALQAALSCADIVHFFKPDNMDWDPGFLQQMPGVMVHASTAAIIDELVREQQPGDAIVIMSNGGFEAIHQRLLAELC